jgi:hypothetical protein
MRRKLLLRARNKCTDLVYSLTDLVGLMSTWGSQELSICSKAYSFCSNFHFICLSTLQAKEGIP